MPWHQPGMMAIEENTSQPWEQVIRKPQNLSAYMLLCESAVGVTEMIFMCPKLEQHFSCLICTYSCIPILGCAVRPMITRFRSHPRPDSGMLEGVYARIELQLHFSWTTRNARPHIPESPLCMQQAAHLPRVCLEVAYFFTRLHHLSFLHLTNFLLPTSPWLWMKSCSPVHTQRLFSYEFILQQSTHP